MEEVRVQDGMRERELRESAKCDLCGKLIGASGLPFFWRIKLDRHGLRADALRRQTGLGMQIGGALAAVMGPNEVLTSIMSSRTVTVCETCAPVETSVYRLGLGGT